MDQFYFMQDGNALHQIFVTQQLWQYHTKPFILEQTKARINMKMNGRHGKR